MSMNTLVTHEVKFYSAVLCEGLGLGLEFFKKVLTTTLHMNHLISSDANMNTVYQIVSISVS